MVPYGSQNYCINHIDGWDCYGFIFFLGSWGLSINMLNQTANLYNFILTQWNKQEKHIISCAIWRVLWVAVHNNIKYHFQTLLEKKVWTSSQLTTAAVPTSKCSSKGGFRTYEEKHNTIECTLITNRGW